MNGRPGFEGRVAAFTSWDVFPYIINEARSGVVVNSGWEPLADPAGLSPREELLNELMVGLLTQSQVAATLAALLGEDYRAEVPRAAPAILEALRNND